MHYNDQVHKTLHGSCMGHNRTAIALRSSTERRKGNPGNRRGLTCDVIDKGENGRTWPDRLLSQFVVSRDSSKGQRRGGTAKGTHTCSVSVLRLISRFTPVFVDAVGN